MTDAKLEKNYKNFVGSKNSCTFATYYQHGYKLKLLSME